MNRSIVKMKKFVKSSTKRTTECVHSHDLTESHGTFDGAISVSLPSEYSSLLELTWNVGRKCLDDVHKSL